MAASLDWQEAFAECEVDGRLLFPFLRESGLKRLAELTAVVHPELVECLCNTGMQKLKACSAARRLLAYADKHCPKILPPGDGSVQTLAPQVLAPSTPDVLLSQERKVAPAQEAIGDHPRVVAPSTARSVDGARRAAAPTPDSARSTTAQATSSDYLKEVAPSTAPSVDGVRRALAPALIALTPQLVTASLQPPSVVIADAEHLPSDIPGPSESVAPVPLSFRDVRRLSGIIARSNFIFSYGLIVDLHASACRDWLVGRSAQCASTWMWLDCPSGWRSEALRFAHMPLPSAVFSTSLVGVRRALYAQRESCGLGAYDLSPSSWGGRDRGDIECPCLQDLHRDAAWFSLHDEAEVRLSALVWRYATLRRLGRTEAIRRAADLVSELTVSATLSCAVLSPRHMLHIHSTHPSRRPTLSRKRDTEFDEDTGVNFITLDSTGARMSFAMARGGHEQALWLRCAGAQLLECMVADASLVASRAKPARRRRRRRRSTAVTAADRACVAAGNAALAANRARVAADFAASIRAKEVRRLASGLAAFLQAARVAQEEVVSCLLAARAQLAEGQRAASSVVYRAASAAAAVAAVATIVAHSCCDVADSYIVNALRDDSSEDDT